MSRMDGMSRATTDSRTSGQRKVLAVTAGTGVAALAVTGFLSVGLGTSQAASSTTGTSTSTSTTTGTTSSTGSTGTVTHSGSSAMASSGGS